MIFGAFLLQAQPPFTGQSQTFASGVNLVEVYATVSDRAERPVTGLTALDFHVAEDDVAQSITTFSAGDFPLSVTLAIDRSFSMAGERLVRSKQAARTFIAALKPTDEIMVLAIGSEVEPIASTIPVSQAAAIRWDAIDPCGTTPLYDAVVQALDTIQDRLGRRALVVISDGVDRDSHTTPAALVARARESAVLIYPVAIGGTSPPLFAELANVTGGRTFFIEDPRRLDSQLATLARELRFQYLLGYAPSRPPGGDREWRSIQVSVARQDLRVCARDRYFSR